MHRDGANHDVQITDQLRRVSRLQAPIQSFAGVVDCPSCLHVPIHQLQQLMTRVDVAVEDKLVLTPALLTQASGERSMHEWHTEMPM